MSLNVIDCNRFKLGCQFLQAASKGQYETVVKLVESGVHVDITNFGRYVYYEGNDYRTPLQVAACNGHSAIVDFLIKHNAALDVRDKFGLTALHLAAENGHKECVDLLLKAFCDHSPTISITQGNTNILKSDHYLRGTTPLHLAAMNNHIECVKSLFFCGADYNAVDEKNRTPLLLAAEIGLSECVFAQLKNALGKQILSIPDYMGNTPLHFAVRHGMVSGVAELLRHGADVNHLNRFKFTPLHKAVFNIYDMKNEDSFEILKLLILKGYNTDINSGCRGESWQTPLAQFVFMYGDKPNGLYKDDAFLEIVCFFIRYGATVDFIEMRSGGIFFENMLFKDEDNYDLLRCMVRTEAVLKLQNVSLQRIMSCDPQMLFRNPQMLFRNPQMMPHDPHMMSHDPHIIPHDQHMGHHHDPHIGCHHDANDRRREELQRRREMRRLLYDELHMRRLLYDELHIRRIPNSDIVREKLKWFENVMTQPRKLQHYCRCAIRRGLRRIRDVHKLSIPVSLKDYILLSKD